MRALLLAAGRQQRWRDGGGQGLKQLVEINGEPVIRRAFRLISARCEDVVTLVDRPSDPVWSGLNPARPAHEDWMGEMGKFLDGRPHWPDDGEVVVLYGDVFYTEATLDLVFAGKVTQPTIYGRAKTRRPESFAIRFRVPEDVPEVERVAAACADANMNRRGGPWRWFLHRHTGLTTYDLGRVRELATPANGWVETPADETDDFDVPAHVAEWHRTFGRQERRTLMSGEIADRRIYGFDRFGREVLVAAPGQKIPAGFQVKAQDFAERGPREAPATGELEVLTVKQLRELADRRGVAWAGLRKAELIEALGA